MIVIAMTAVGWLALIVLFVTACLAARLGDHQETRPTLDR
jgi:hypothetical protein